MACMWVLLVQLCAALAQCLAGYPSCVRGRWEPLTRHTSIFRQWLYPATKSAFIPHFISFFPPCLRPLSAYCPSESVAGGFRAHRGDPCLWSRAVDVGHAAKDASSCCMGDECAGGKVEMLLPVACASCCCWAAFLSLFYGPRTIRAFFPPFSNVQPLRSECMSETKII